MLGDTTRVLVTHQRQYLRHCDRVVVMRGGAIFAVGSFEELAARGLAEVCGGGGGGAGEGEGEPAELLDEDVQERPSAGEPREEEEEEGEDGEEEGGGGEGGGWTEKEELRERGATTSTATAADVAGPIVEAGAVSTAGPLDNGVGSAAGTSAEGAGSREGGAKGGGDAGRRALQGGRCVDPMSFHLAVYLTAFPSD